MHFGAALEVLKLGRRVARKGWNGKGMWLMMVATWSPGLMDAQTEKMEKFPFIAMKTADDKLVPWLASQTDVLSEDWTIVD